MKQVVPMGYSRSKMGTSLAVAVAVGTALLTLLFVKNGAAFSDMKYFCIVAAVLILLFILCGTTKNRKDRAKIAHMQFMLSCPSVEGTVREIKRIPYYFGREFKENQKFCTRERNSVYRIVAAVQSPVTGSEEIVVSEPYASNVAEYISNNSVTVHYSKNGEYWIQL